MDDSSSWGRLVLSFLSGKVHVHVISPLPFGLVSSDRKRSARSSDLSSFSAEPAVESFPRSMADDFTGPFAHAVFQATAARRVLAAAVRLSVWPRKHMRISALLVWFLSSSIDLAMLYLHHCACDEAREVGFFSHRSVAALTMLDWLLQDQTYRHVLTAVDFVGDQYRQLADVFLMDSLVAEYIVRRNAHGVTVDLAQSILVLLRLWSHRPRSARVTRWLQRLLWHRHTRRRYGVCLRRNFMLGITSFPLQRELSDHEITQRVLRECFDM